MLCEGKGKVQQLRQISRDYHIAIRSPGGYDALNKKFNLALRAAREWNYNGRPSHILHMGDFDADGLEIFDVFCEDVLAFLDAHILDDAEDVLTFKRIAVIPEQVPEERRKTFDKAKVKEKNYRGKRWPHPYDAQLESLGVERILEIAREEVENVLDLDQIERDKETSKPERERIRETMQRIAEEEEE